MELTAQAAKEIAASSNGFALDLYAQLRSADGNLFFSPFSVFCALSMTHAGAQGETAAQIAGTLHLDPGRERVHEDIGAVLRGLRGGKDDRHQLHIANALWAKKGYRFLESFSRRMREAYGARPEEADFDDPAAACEAINAWVAGETNGKIRQLLSPQAIDQFTRAVLANAIYFRAAWQETFDKEFTRDAPFHVLPGVSVPVPTMHRTDDLRYADLGALRALEIPYDGRRLAMLILLPKAVDGLAQVERSLTPALLRGDGLASAEVSLYLPRFRAETGYALAEALKAMGMPRAFDDRKAEFFSMVEGEPLCISSVIHQAFVDVNEAGTEAAAATAVVMAMLGSMVRESEPVIFRVDRPFLFLIRDRRTGCVLFLGRIRDPAVSR